jgi:malic enzyme
VLQWEDFKQHNAIRLLHRYRHRLPSFNDDIQGTAAVVLAGILAALRERGEPLGTQRIVLLGAGAAGLGIADLVTAAMVGEGIPDEQARRSIVLLDSRGLVYQGRDNVDEDKRPYARSLAELGLPPGQGKDHYDLPTVVRAVAPTILIGTTGTPGAFTKDAIVTMAERVPEPIVLPLSNPTANCEALPADLLDWSDGRALVATGSPFDPVEVNGGRRLIGQANNVFIFPGLGLGAIVSHAREITDAMFLVAAATLASMTADERLAQGALYPRLADLRPISRAIAIAVARQAHQSGVAGRVSTDIEADVDAAMWWPEYPSVGDHSVSGAR